MSFFNELNQFSNRTALLDDSGKQISYVQLHEMGQEMGKVLKERHLVFMLCRNSIGSISGYLGFLKNNVAVGLFDWKMDMALFKNLVETYQPQYIYIYKGQSEEFSNYNCIYEFMDYQLLRTHYEGYSMYNQLALLLTTSGSTGSPQLVRFDYEKVQLNAEIFADILKISGSERPVTTLPMNFTYGLAIINGHLCRGATILVTEKTFVERSFWDFFSENHGTSIAGVPYSYQILKKIGFFKMELPSLCCMTEAGGKLPENLHWEIAQYAKDKNKEFIVLYGQTEAMPCMVYLPHEYSIEKCGSMGIPSINSKVSLMDVAEGQYRNNKGRKAGELVYESKSVALGYAEKKEDLIKGDEWKGKLKTGDIVEIDENGFLYFIARRKRFIKIFGERISLDEVEEMVKKQFCDYELACSGYDDKIIIYITAKSDGLGQRMISFLSSKTKFPPQIFEVKLVDEICRNKSGKVLYSILSRK